MGRVFPPNKVCSESPWEQVGGDLESEPRNSHVTRNSSLYFADFGAHHLRVVALQLCAAIRLVVEGAFVLVRVSVHTTEEVLATASKSYRGNKVLY